MVKHCISCINYDSLGFVSCWPMKFGDGNPSFQPEVEVHKCLMFQFLGGGGVSYIMA